MPTEQTQVEYYHYYRASQKRVQQWVQKTSQELQAGTASAGRSSDLRLNTGDSGKVVERGNGDASGSGSRRKGSRRRSPSSSKRQLRDQDHQVDGLRSRDPSSRSPSTRKKAKTNSNDPRSRKPYSSEALTISSLLPFGVLIFVLTPPSVATLFSATILLAGYFCVDYSVSITHKF